MKAVRRPVALPVSRKKKAKVAEKDTERIKR